MASKLLIKQLKSSDPQKRFVAVKQIAREKDVTMLKTLSDMAANDPDEQVRSVAARAVQFIRGEGKAESVAQKAAQREAPVKEISAKEQARAKGYIDSAIGLQINGERDKALKDLAKALEINPKLRKDNFFISVLEEASGMPRDEAFQIIADDEAIKSVSKNEKVRRKSQRAEAHQEDVSRSRWSSVVMDLLIYTLILVFATMFLPIVAGQAAESYLNGYQAAVDSCVPGSRIVTEQCPSPLEPEIFELVGTLRQFGLMTGVLLGVGAGIAGVIGLLINLFFTHMAARFMFGGDATFPHLIYKVVSFYNSRLPILYGIFYLAIVLAFLMGAPLVFGIVMGAASLYSLYISFKTMSKVGEAYDFGAMKGCLSLVVGSFIVGIINFVFSLALGGTIATLFSSTMGAVT